MWTFVWPLFLLSLVCLNHGSQVSEEVAEDRTHPGKCLDKSTGKYYKLGSSWHPPDACYGKTCGGADRKGYLTIYGEPCSYPVNLPDNCKMTAPSLHRTFPACCPTLNCTGDVEEINEVG